MSNGIFNIPTPVNEPNLTYAPGTSERDTLKATLKQMKAEKADLPMFIGGKEIRTGERAEIRPPHEINYVLGHYHKGNASHVKQAIAAAMRAKKNWESLSWENRASIFLKAADLLASKYRARINAATML